MRAYSRLRKLLGDCELSIPELHRRILGNGLRINIRSLYRLSDEEQPIERLDLRVAGAICQACAVPLTAWIVFEEEAGQLQTLAADQQDRLEFLMARNNAGPLTDREKNELQALVRAAEAITLANARILASHHMRETTSTAEIAGSAA
jgi:hypothetical protein